MHPDQSTPDSHRYAAADSNESQDATGGVPQGESFPEQNSETKQNAVEEDPPHSTDVE